MKDLVPQSDRFTTADHAKRGEAIIEYVSAGLAYFSEGWSEAFMLPLRRLIKKRLEQMEEAVVADIRAGLITAEAVIEEERLASFVLRVRRAAVEGVAQHKLRLMARIFFKSAPREDYAEDEMADFWAITVQLNSSDIKVLAVLKAARENGFGRDSDEERSSRRISAELDSNNAFENELAFREAVLALVRFGFIDAVSGWGSLVYFVTDRCLLYIDKLDFTNLDAPPST
ncbi:hypothetical protein [Agrobacterium larrymoorei]|uniref:hypothetical protein n=1 Tax=Agrobacterium larrymoorei TaxID=160699 RepID=UPI0030BE26BA